MEREYDIDISEIDFKGNQERIRKQLKKNKIRNIALNILEAIVLTIIGLVVAFTPAIIELFF